MNCIIVTILGAQNALVRECGTGGAKRRRESIIISVNHRKLYDTRKYPRPRGKQYHGLYAFKNLFNVMMKSKKKFIKEQSEGPNRIKQN